MPAQLPQFDAEVCSLGRLACAVCTDCADACPTAALSMSDDGLELDPTTCTACGACVSACPQRAISLPGQEPVVAPDRHGAAALICPQHAQRGQVCLQAIGLQDLAALWIAGVRVLHLGLGDCETCNSGGGLIFDGRLRDFNLLLADRNFSPIITKKGSMQDLRNLPKLGAQNDLPNTWRRALFGLGTAKLADGKLAGLARIQAVKAKGNASPRFDFAPQIDPELCSGCNACTRICPEASLTLINVGTDDVAYDLDPVSCTGCRLCMQVCDETAITLTPLGVSAPQVPLVGFICRACGAPAHLPQAQGAGDGLCSICAKSNHHRKLFQVIV